MNKELAVEKKIIIDDNYDMYIYLENIYKYYFERYLISKINLIKYDNMIKDSGLDFGVSIYFNKQGDNSLKEFLPLNYISVINRFFVEKLKESELELLKKYAKNKDYIYDNTIEKLIENTFKDVIRTDLFNEQYNEKKFKIFYGSAVPSNEAFNDDLVLKIYYAKNKEKYDDEEFIDNLNKKNMFLDKIKEDLKNDVFNKLNVGCTVLSQKVYK